MPTRPWIYLINTFEVNTRDSYKKALSIGEDHKAKLQAHQADADIAALIATFNPVLASYKAIDQNLQSVLGTYKGKTQTVEELFLELSKTKLPYWEGQIFSFYPEGSSTATMLFPNKRKPFNEGTYEQRISSIKVLGDKCALDSQLVTVSVNILAFWSQIESARLSQQADGEGTADALRELRENARVVLCEELYGNLGALMKKHKSDPLEVAQYFELSYLRDTGGDADEFIITPQQVINLLDNVVAGQVADIRIKNTSLEDVPVQFYFASTASATPQGPVFTVQKGEVKILNESDIAPLQSFLNAFNDDDHAATFEVTGL